MKLVMGYQKFERPAVVLLWPIFWLKMKFMVVRNARKKKLKICGVHLFFCWN